jgi:hypothetical protein
MDNYKYLIADRALLVSWFVRSRGFAVSRSVYFQVRAKVDRPLQR